MAIVRKKKYLDDRYYFRAPGQLRLDCIAFGIDISKTCREALEAEVQKKIAAESITSKRLSNRKGNRK
ncbi:MAG: hypothetical protein E6R04_07205 [Spirochaetes bacterium]|nr:MAG: hypothetical protein E6R04_07205 [Spirochaetota bacterium]